jgi:hypothetical protein
MINRLKALRRRSVSGPGPSNIGRRIALSVPLPSRSAATAGQEENRALDVPRLKWVESGTVASSNRSIEADGRLHGRAKQCRLEAQREKFA